MGSQFDSARSYGSGKDVVEGGVDMKEAMYGVGNLQSSPAMKTFYNKALLSTNGADMAHEFSLVRRDVTELSAVGLVYSTQPNPQPNPTF